MLSFWKSSAQSPDREGQPSAPPFVPRAMRTLKIFVSHSSEDVALVESLVDLLRSSLNLAAVEIRCSSLDGHRLPGGVATEFEVRKEILAAPVFLAVISKASRSSLYALFEMGARWGTGKILIPVLATTADMALLEGPLAGLNSIDLDASGQIHQLIENVAQLLELTAESPAVYLKQVTAVLAVPRNQPGTAAKNFAASAPQAEPFVPAEEEVLGPAALEAIRLAKLLISEIKLNHEAEVEEGRRHRDLGRRLSEEIRSARRTYDEYTSAGDSRDYFHELLVEILAGGDETALED